MNAGEFRREFPLFAAHPGLHYLDNAATAQILGAALEAMRHHEATARANVLRGTHRLAAAADRAYERARESAARFLNASPDEIVFTSGATASLNLVAHSLGDTLRTGDRIAVSVAEHHSNLLPWQRLRDGKGVDLRVIGVASDGRLDLGGIDALLEGCRLLAVTHCSNVTGAMTDVAALVAAAKRAGARVLLDGAQAVQHGPQDVQALGVDFYAFSGHKCFGPGGVGVLWGRRDVLAALPPFMLGGGMVGDVSLEGCAWAEPPQRFEAGTPPVAAAIGLAAALDRMRTLPWPDIRARELRLHRMAADGLRTIPGLRLLAPRPDGDDDSAPIVSFIIDGLHPHDICQVLDAHDVAARGGHHCARPLLAALGAESCVRASFALYNDEADVAALLAALRASIAALR